MSNKVTFYKDLESPKTSDSKSEEHKPYVPQYKLMGMEPQRMENTAVAADYRSPQPTFTDDNPRVRKSGIRQPYAETTAPPNSRGAVPTVGHNREHTWSGVDAEIIDDISLDPNTPMIDNNEYVTNEALRMPSNQSMAGSKQVNDHHNDSILSVLHNLTEGAYLLFIDGVPVCSGPMEDIQEQAKLLSFGEHEFCDGNPIPLEDIMIVKRIPIKVGLFLG